MDSVLFERVARFVARETAVARQRLAPSTRLEADLGVTGGDAAELIAAFAAEFRVDLAGFEFSRHFGDERPATPWSLARGLAIWAATTRRGVSSREPVTLAQLTVSAGAGRWVRV